MSLEYAIQGLAEAEHVLVASDYDGTLANLVSHPDLAAPNEDSIAALRRLAANPDVSVLIVSGRTLRDLRRFIPQTDGLVLIGEHGSDDGKGIDPELTGRIEPVLEELERIASTVPGSWVEVKRYAGAFHHRNSDPEVAAAALSRIRAWTETTDGLILTEGKRVLEVSVTTRHKGDAVIEVKERTGADRIVFLGDDTTDEAVFGVLGPKDIGVKVGPGESKAHYRVDDVEAVAVLLNQIATMAESRR